MKRMLINATQLEERRLAVVDGQILLDYETEISGQEQRKSNIYKAIVTRVEPSLEACFVDYGEDRHGFLPFKEISRQYFAEDVRPEQTSIQEAISVGQELLVQVEKEERGNKGAALTTFISLAGRYVVLMPNNPRGGGISRRVEESDRAKLKESMSGLEYARGMSIIARTAGIGRSTEELQWDLNYLIKLWHAIETAGNALKKPELIYQESNLVIRALRDYFNADIDEILIDEDSVFEQAKQFVTYVMPEHVDCVKRYTGSNALFSRFQIEHQIESAYTRSVGLPSGGSIVIDHTEALVAIDVNSARSIRGGDVEETATRTNIEAAEEAARQMRLRDLGGLIVIDFIDMEDQKNRKEVETRLREVLREDRARVQLGTISRFGLMEMSRQRLKPALNESVSIPCPRCSGSGHIRNTDSSALQILRIIQEEAIKDSTAAVQVQVPVEVVSFLLNEKRSEIAKIEAKERISIIIIPNKTLETPNYHLERFKSDDPRLENMPVSYKIAENFEAAADEASNAKQEPTNKQQPIIKGVLRDDPAPVVLKEKTSLLAKVCTAVKNLFAAEPKPEPVKAAPNGRKTHQQNRRRPQKKVNSQDNAKTSNAAEAKTNPRNPRNANAKRNTAEGNKRNQATADKEQTGAAKDETVKTKPQRQPRQRNKVADTNAKVDTAANKGQGLVVAKEFPLVATEPGNEVSPETAATTEEKKPPRERKSRGRYGRDRRDKRNDNAETSTAATQASVAAEVTAATEVAEPTNAATAEPVVTNAVQTNAAAEVIALTTPALTPAAVVVTVDETVTAAVANTANAAEAVAEESATAALIEPTKFDIASLETMIAPLGLQWIQSDATKVAAAQQEIAAAQTQQAKLGRELPSRKTELVENLILVQTKQDLAQIQFPFERN